MKKVLQFAIAKIMQKDVVTIDKEDTIARAAQILQSHNFHHIPVIDDQRQVIGMISQTDIDKISWGKSLFVNHQKEALNEALFTTLRSVDIMTKEVFVMDKSQSIKAACQAFQKSQFRAIPIVENNALVGILTPIDLIRLIQECD